MPLSDSFTQHLYNTSSGVPILTLLQVNLDGTLYYYVNNNESVTSSVSGVSRTYQASAFNITLPENSSEGTPRASLQLDPADNAIVSRLRATNSRILITLWVVAGNALNVPEIGPVEYESTDFNISQGNITIGLEIEPILDRIIPAKRFTPRLFPALWDREA